MCCQYVSPEELRGWTYLSTNTFSPRKRCMWKFSILKVIEICNWTLTCF